MEQAARVIIKYWRQYKAKKMSDFGMIAKLNQKAVFGRTVDVIYMPSIRKCFICKDRNSSRLCLGVSPLLQFLNPIVPRSLVL